MEHINITAVVIVAIIGLGLIIFVTLRNQKDKKELNPDAPEAMEEEKNDIIEDREKL